LVKKESDSKAQYGDASDAEVRVFQRERLEKETVPGMRQDSDALLGDAVGQKKEKSGLTAPFGQSSTRRNRRKTQLSLQTAAGKKKTSK